jgi:hypothetical protein
MKRPVFLDYSEVFELNVNLDIKIEKVGEMEVVIIDNFYKNPEMVRDLILNIPATNIQSVTGGTQGYRTQASLDLTNLSKIWHYLSTTIYPHARGWSFDSVYNCFNYCNFNSNILTFKEQVNNRTHSWGVPHVDGDYEDVISNGDEMIKDMGGLAGIVYLNTPEECAGGTSFYSFDGKQTVDQNSRPDVLYKNDKEPFDGWVQGSCGDWKLLNTVEMKWNRFIMYPNWILHHPDIKEEMNFDGSPIYRINQILFP